MNKEQLMQEQIMREQLMRDYISRVLEDADIDFLTQLASEAIEHTLEPVSYDELVEIVQDTYPDLLAQEE